VAAAPASRPLDDAHRHAPLALDERRQGDCRARPLARTQVFPVLLCRSVWRAALEAGACSARARDRGGRCGLRRLCRMARRGNSARTPTGLRERAVSHTPARHAFRCGHAFRLPRRSLGRWTRRWATCWQCRTRRR
jgi:hypothetical protein